MAICLVQVREGNPFFITIPMDGEDRVSLPSMDCRVLEKIIWILRQYPVRPEVSAVVAAVTDFALINFHISTYENIPEEFFLTILLKDAMRLSYREIINLVDEKTPKQ